MTDIILSVNNLSVEFDVHQNKKWPWSKPQKLRAVNNVSFDLNRGETLGIVGESGCGKSSLIRALCGLTPTSGGEITMNGRTLDAAARKQNPRLMQMVFQDPVAALNPRMTVAEIVREPVNAFMPGLPAAEREAKVIAMLDRVGIAQRDLGRYPHEFSGGQCQRIGIARALICEPDLLLCDEPVSALDVSVQAQVINLLHDLQQDLGLTMIFIAHNLGIVHHISDHIMVMYSGGVMEYAPAGALIAKPQHPYTRALLSAIPVTDPTHHFAPDIPVGDLPDPLSLPTGCLFSNRCPKVFDRCAARPELKGTIAEGRKLACHLSE